MSASLDAGTAALLAGSLRELLPAHADGRGLAEALDGLGWAEVLAEDPATATTLLFTQHGRSLATSRALDDVVLAELAGVLPAPAGAVLHPHPLDGAEPAGDAIRGLLLGPVDAGTGVAVPVSTGGPTGLLVLPAEELTAGAVAVGGMDPGSAWLAVEGVPLPAAPPAPAGDAWTRAVAAARRALTAELVGVCAAALELAVAHTSARVQYGRPIGSFQAVRHRLAESHVAITATRTTLEAAWTAAAAPDGGSWAATVAKLRAGAAQAEVMRHCVQVFGAMGLTRESDLHRYVGRAAALDALLGGSALLAEAVGTALLDGAEADPVVHI
jgi:Acyl-CoA dehydrogenase, C-terminal domain